MNLNILAPTSETITHKGVTITVTEMRACDMAAMEDVDAKDRGAALLAATVMIDGKAIGFDAARTMGAALFRKLMPISLRLNGMDVEEDADADAEAPAAGNGKAA